MPCYNPPPEWQDRQRKSAEYAVRWLCSVASDELNDMPRDVVAWFLDHRQIDLEMARSRPDSAAQRKEMDGAQADIARAKRVLEKFA